MLCRFYGFGIEEVRTMPMDEFNDKIKQIGVILKLELGEDDKKETSLTGGNAFNLAQRIFPRGKK